MKQKDIALIAVVVFISAVFSIVISKSVFVKPVNRQQEVEVVQAINSKFTPPAKKYFNDKSFDPTRSITIGDNANPDPFTKKKQ